MPERSLVKFSTAVGLGSLGLGSAAIRSAVSRGIRRKALSADLLVLTYSIGPDQDTDVDAKDRVKVWLRLGKSRCSAPG